MKSSAIAIEQRIHECGRHALIVSVPTLEASALGASPLTPGEREVTRLAALGLSNVEIARQRQAAARTVANQLAAAFRKLNIGSRCELARVLT